MKCWKCFAPYDISSGEKLGFRAVCEKCLASLHCCKNCKNYQPGLPNDCKIPDTDYIPDREASNFCEFFELQTEKPAKKADISEVSQKLFGETDKGIIRHFDDLFYD